jgi:tRNA-2-methylthio-N6-dimethylallyladenosine synthase
MHGCDNFCSYCIVPTCGGREVSRSPASVLEEIASWRTRGVLEITLLGQNVNSYRWVKAMERSSIFPPAAPVAEKVRTIRWVRFLSSHPKDLSSRAIEVLREHPVFCRHVHLCVQHGSNRCFRREPPLYPGALSGAGGRAQDALPRRVPDHRHPHGFPGGRRRTWKPRWTSCGTVRFLRVHMYPYYNPGRAPPPTICPGGSPIGKEGTAGQGHRSPAHSSPRKRCVPASVPRKPS